MIKIYYTTDTHGVVLPVNYANNQIVPIGLLSCGAEFKKDGNTLIIDAGDTIQGSPFTKYMWENLDECIVAQVFNKIGYDYVTLGNHDFNYGYNILKKYVDTLNAKCVVANIVDKTNQLKIIPYDIHECEDGTKIGVVGAVTEFVPIWEKPEHLENIEIKDVFSSLKQALELIKNKCDVTICIYHGGFECDIVTGEVLSNTKENIGYKICQELDFDILLTGHQHMPVDGADLFGTFAMQLKHNAVEYGYIEIDGKNIKGEVRKPQNIAVEISPLLKQIQGEVNKWLDQSVGKFNLKIEAKDKLTLALEGSLLANFCNQVQLDYTKADFSCTALGNNLMGFDTSITIRDIVAAYQVPNTLKVLKVNYNILKQALERVAQYYALVDDEIQISNKFLKPKITHYNYDFFSGFYYTIDISKPIGNRVTINTPLDKNKDYTLCMSDYRATGTGEYDFYSKCEIIREYSENIQELIIEYIQKHKNLMVDDTRYFTIIK
ncbi:bifunctional metallophosphatase/5'-nucleotidase [Epulopiscium sp. SCG-B10WGA-EpuloA2]|nr:bifunctional metallophosphatase/5'-nucleotidase [Epulopiscium sp. SCG-B10WGA-EpuloA2]